MPYNPLRGGVEGRGALEASFDVSVVGDPEPPPRFGGVAAPSPPPPAAFAGLLFFVLFIYLGAQRGYILLYYE